MIEGAGDEVPDDDFKAALRFAQENVAKLVEAQEELARKAGKEKRVSELKLVQQEILDVAYEVAGKPD